MGTLTINQLPVVKIDWPIDRSTPVVLIRPDGATIRSTIEEVLNTYLTQQLKKTDDTQ